MNFEEVSLSIRVQSADHAVVCCINLKQVLTLSQVLAGHDLVLWTWLLIIMFLNLLFWAMLTWICHPSVGLYSGDKDTMLYAAASLQSRFLWCKTRTEDEWNLWAPCFIWGYPTAILFCIHDVELLEKKRGSSSDCFLQKETHSYSQLLHLYSIFNLQLFLSIL